jgi:predicted transcriptional regulator
MALETPVQHLQRALEVAWDKRVPEVLRAVREMLEFIVSAKESDVTRAITIRTDEETLERLEGLARASERSRNFLANQALKEFLERHGATGNAVQAGVPVAERLEDYRSAFWQEDDGEAFLTYLEEERKRSLQADRLRDLE